MNSKSAWMPLASGLLSLLAVSSCKAPTSNLGSRPKWTQPRDQWSHDPRSETGVLALEYPETEWLVVSAEGRANEDFAAKAAALLAAEQELITTMTTEAYRWVSSNSRVLIQNQVESYEDVVRTQVEVTAEGPLIGRTVLREWIGFHEGLSVAYVLVALEKRTACARAMQMVASEFSRAEMLESQVESAMQQLDHASGAHRFADFYEAVLRIQTLLGSIEYLRKDHKEEFQRPVEWDEREGKLRGTCATYFSSLRQFTRASNSSLIVVTRGSPQPGFELTLSFVSPKPSPLRTCDLRICDTSRPDTKRVCRSDDVGRVYVPLSVNKDTPQGEYEARITYRLCTDHESDAESRPGCARCRLEDALALPVGFRLNADRHLFQELFSRASERAAAGDHAGARALLTEAAAVVFDVPVDREQCALRLAVLDVEECLWSATALQQMGNYDDALQKYVRAYAEACEVPNGEVHQQEARLALQACSVAYCRNAATVGNVVALEACYQSVGALQERHWETGLDEAFLLVRQKLPCAGCGFTGKCSRCAGDGRYTDDCNRCGGSGIVDVDCDECVGGRVVCPECDGQRDVSRESCGVCGGDGRYLCEGGCVQGTCGFCFGRGMVNGYTCTTCQGSGTLFGFPWIQKICGRCMGTGVETCDRCGGAGSVLTCSNCDEQGKVACRECEGGRVDATCGECEGQRKVSYYCGQCQRSGTCATCQGDGFRAMPEPQR